jgi:hypothetical protein
MKDSSEAGAADEIIGEFRVTVSTSIPTLDHSNLVDDLIQKPQGQYTLVHPKNIANGKNKSSGTFNILYFKVERVPSFVDYISGGTELNLMIAIDFTAINGEPFILYRIKLIFSSRRSSQSGFSSLYRRWPQLELVPTSYLRCWTDLARI